MRKHDPVVERCQFCIKGLQVGLARVPGIAGGTDKAKDLFGLFDDTIARLLTVAK